jgi:hypothetical protein
MMCPWTSYKKIEKILKNFFFGILKINEEWSRIRIRRMMCLWVSYETKNLK